LPHPVHIFPGDKFICSVTEKGRCYEFKEDIGREIVIDTIVTFDVSEAILEVENGIGAVFGRATDRKSGTESDRRLT